MKSDASVTKFQVNNTKEGAVLVVTLAMTMTPERVEEIANLYGRGELAMQLDAKQLALGDAPAIEMTRDDCAECHHAKADHLLEAGNCIVQMRDGDAAVPCLCKTYVAPEAPPSEETDEAPPEAA